ncbi:MAG TPA: hypothetical protein VIG47_10615 [Gemmatimonadaceae bacterium]|jgi:hypothetical protein
MSAHKITITLDVSTEERTASIERRVEAMISHGSVHDAFAQAGIDVIHHEVDVRPSSDVVWCPRGCGQPMSPEGCARCATK